MLNRLLNIPFIERWLPDHIRPVEDRYLSDEASRILISEAEKLLETLIEHAENGADIKALRKKEKAYRIYCKVKRRKIKLLLYDTKYSSALVKKRIHIECFRKYIKAVNGVGKCTHTSIHYIHQGETYVRSIKKSPFVQPLLYKIDMLDDALLGQFIDKSRLTSFQGAIKEKNQDAITLLQDMKRVVNYQASHTLDPLLESRLVRIIEEAEKIITHYDLLEIEDKHLIKRLLRNDIPKLMHTYLSLSAKNQMLSKEDVFVSLAKMELTLLSVVEQVENSKLTQLQHLLKLNERRYSSKNVNDRKP